MYSCVSLNILSSGISSLDCLAGYLSSDRYRELRFALSRNAHTATDLTVFSSLQDYVDHMQPIHCPTRGLVGQ